MIAEINKMSTISKTYKAIQNKGNKSVSDLNGEFIRANWNPYYGKDKDISGKILTSMNKVSSGLESLEATFNLNLPENLGTVAFISILEHSIYTTKTTTTTGVAAVNQTSYDGLINSILTSNLGIFTKPKTSILGSDEDLNAISRYIFFDEGATETEARARMFLTGNKQAVFYTDVTKKLSNFVLNMDNLTAHNTGATATGYKVISDIDSLMDTVTVEKKSVAAGFEIVKQFLTPVCNFWNATPSASNWNGWTREIINQTITFLKEGKKQTGTGTLPRETLTLFRYLHDSVTRNNNVGYELSYEILTYAYDEYAPLLVEYFNSSALQTDKDFGGLLEAMRLKNKDLFKASILSHFLKLSAQIYLDEPIGYNNLLVGHAKDRKDKILSASETYINNLKAAVSGSTVVNTLSSALTTFEGALITHTTNLDTAIANATTAFRTSLNITTYNQACSNARDAYFVSINSSLGTFKTSVNNALTGVTVAANHKTTFEGVVGRDDVSATPSTPAVPGIPGSALTDYNTAVGNTLLEKTETDSKKQRAHFRTLAAIASIQKSFGSDQEKFRSWLSDLEDEMVSDEKVVASEVVTYVKDNVTSGNRLAMSNPTTAFPGTYGAWVYGRSAYFSEDEKVYVDNANANNNITIDALGRATILLFFTLLAIRTLKNGSLDHFKLGATDIALPVSASSPLFAFPPVIDLAYLALGIDKGSLLIEGEYNDVQVEEFMIQKMVGEHTVPANFLRAVMERVTFVIDDYSKPNYIPVRSNIYSEVKQDVHICFPSSAKILVKNTGSKTLKVRLSVVNRNDLSQKEVYDLDSGKIALLTC